MHKTDIFDASMHRPVRMVVYIRKIESKNSSTQTQNYRVHKENDNESLLMCLIRSDNKHQRARRTKNGSKFQIFKNLLKK